MIYFGLLLIVVVIGISGRIYIYNSNNVVYYTITNVDINETIVYDNSTFFKFVVEIEVWNRGFHEIRVTHGSECGILPSLQIKLNQSVMYSITYKKLCSNILQAGSTKIKPGLTKLNSTIGVLFREKMQDLPNGDYVFSFQPVKPGTTFGYTLSVTNLNKNRNIEPVPVNKNMQLLQYTNWIWWVPFFALISIISVRYIIMYIKKLT